MEDIVNENTQVETSTMEPDTGAYLSAIKDIKANSVSLDEYNKMKSERDELLNSIVSGNATFKPDETEVVEKQNIDISELKNNLFNKESTNLEFIDNALKLRDELISKGEKDPFLPWGHNISPTDEDVAKANKVADVLKECVEIADGNSDIFTRELQRRMVDTKLPRK